VATLLLEASHKEQRCFLWAQELGTNAFPVRCKQYMDMVINVL